MRIFCDRHHDGLLESLRLLFEVRLGHELYTPIGLSWFEMGYWKINDSIETANQFLTPGTTPDDGTGIIKHYKTMTLDEFRSTPIDVVIASLPQHVEPFKQLAAEKGAKFIYQMGNNWDIPDYPTLNVLASIARKPTAANVIWYHEEFSTDTYRPSPVEPNKKVYSFVNIIQNTGDGWRDYQALKWAMEPEGWEFRAFGAQGPDGNIDGEQVIADKMREATFIYHVKPFGDGFGLILHQAYSIGRPIITRPSDYHGQLGSQLIAPWTYLDIDTFSINDIKNQMNELISKPDKLKEMGNNSANRFKELVNYNQEAKEIEQWLTNLK